MRVLFVTNHIEDAMPTIRKAQTYWDNKRIFWAVAENHQAICDYFNVIFLLSYRKIIDEETLERVDGNVIVFHSSDLPKGRGWAPIYTAIASGYKYHTITMCYADKEMDAGNILAKAKCRIRNNYTAGMLRNIGRQLISYLIGEYVLYFETKTCPGMIQQGAPTLVSKRNT